MLQSSQIKTLLGEEDTERFYKELQRNQWLREKIKLILEDRIKKLANEEELCYTKYSTEDILKSISYRKALRELSNIVYKD